MPEEGRRMPLGAEPVSGGVHFRVWAPRRRRVEVVLEGGPGARLGRRAFGLESEDGGYFSARIPEAGPGSLYRYRLDGDAAFPDPASRFQPDGPHGPSQVVDPLPYEWRDSPWRGLTREGQVLYELHVGTFTREGTWRAAAAHLRELAELGITAVELLPVADFPGRFGWGYDGVNLYAPTRLYGEPGEFRRFVDEAHLCGLGVLLDVVYNHLGPDGNYLAQYSADYFTDRYRNEWGTPVNFDGPGSGPVREFFSENAAYWIREFHLDGLRLDATQSMFDASDEHVLCLIQRKAREAAGARRILLVAENEPQQAHLVRPAGAGGFGLDCAWNDDFHHAARVALTGTREAYFFDYRGTAQELISAVRSGYLYQGQHYRWQKQRRGSPAHGVPPSAFVCYLQNHDQVANSPGGKRLHQLTSAGRLRAATTLLLLAPATPLLFQGQEFCASSPFLYFADHHPELARLVRSGRSEFLRQFPSLATAEAAALLTDPAAAETFERSRLDHAERERHATAWRLHRDLLRLRREDPVLGAQPRSAPEGAVLAEDALVLRFRAPGGNDRLVVVNLGRALHLDVVPEPLLAPPAGHQWRVLWSSEDPSYGGAGTPAPESPEGWRLLPESALVLEPVLRADASDPPTEAAEVPAAGEA